MSQYINRILMVGSTSVMNYGSPRGIFILYLPPAHVGLTYIVGGAFSQFRNLAKKSRQDCQVHLLNPGHHSFCHNGRDDDIRAI
jgi:hypothetical protein